MLIVAFLYFSAVLALTVIARRIPSSLPSLKVYKINLLRTTIYSFSTLFGRVPRLNQKLERAKLK